jgi:hypothetical protein
MTQPPPYLSGDVGPSWAAQQPPATWPPAPWPPAPPYGYGGPSWPYGAPPAWGPPGSWGAPPAPSGRRPPSRKTVALVVGGVVLAIALIAVVVIAGINVGRTQAELAAAVPTTTLAPSDPAGLGDDPGLDGYASRCHDGDLQACDDLYQLSDPMSGYEQYGLTCGGRVKPLEVAFCTELED